MTLLTNKAQISILQLDGIKQKLRHIIIFLKLFIPSDPQIQEVVHAISRPKIIPIQPNPLQPGQPILILVLLILLVLLCPLPRSPAAPMPALTVLLQAVTVVPARR